MRKLTTEQFIEKARAVHGDKYDYSKVEYINNRTKVNIVCPIHGEFKQNAGHHLHGFGCFKCANKIRREAQLSTTKYFIEKSKEIYREEYDYSKVEYNGNKNRVIIKCSIHGEFKQRPNDFLMGHACPYCNSSNGEKYIREYLKTNRIYYEEQKTFNDCKYRYKLRYDFYLQNENLLIEFDGRQHFDAIDAWGGKKKLQETQKRDRIKTEYAKKHNIDLLRISYKDIDNIESILDEKLGLQRRVG